MNPVDTAADTAAPVIPRAQVAYGTIVYWITFASAVIVTIGSALALIFPDHNVLHPAASFGAIFAGHGPDQIWAASREGAFPGGHFYLRNMLTGDGLTQFGVAIGCAAALPALLAAAVAYGRARAYGFALLSLWVGAMVLFAAAGIIALG